MKKLKNIIILILLVLLLLSCILIFFLLKNSDSNSLLPDVNVSDWIGSQDLEHEKKETSQIAIPGMPSSLVFRANTTEQKVNFYNPEINNCLFLLSLYVDDTCYWQSGYLEPSKCYYNIELDEPLSVGEYDAYLLTQCYRKDGTALNSAKVGFTLKVIE